MMKCYRLAFGVIVVYILCFIKTTNQIELNRNKNCQLHSGQMTLDLNKLYKPEGYVTSEKYIINICGEVKQCGENVVACEINTTGSLIPIALADNWIISKRNLIYKHMEKRTVQISLLCDYSLLEPKIDVLSSSGKHGMKLTFASSYLCFPEPTVCKIELDGTEIDISSLYRDKNWKVKNNISNDQIYLNLCGPMNPINKYPGCAENGTKVCLLTNTEGISLNLGSSSSELSGNNDLNGLSLSFSGGYICQARKSTVTKIEFTCGFDEKGPVLISKTECEYIIHWRTPSACPHYVSKSNNCLINDNLFNKHNYRITSMEQEDTLPNNKVIKYNICDNLKTACNKNRTDVSFCLLQNKTETILGISNNSVYSRDGLLTIQMTGENCGLLKKYSVFVTFICDYTKNKPTRFKFSEDLCTVNVTIFTNQVCKEPNPQNVECITDTNKSGKYFNLTGLQLKDHNYEVEDYKNNVTYILNMCQPVLFSPTTLCGGVICARNNSEPDISKRFLDLGFLNSFKINDDQNTLSVEMDGALCKGKYVNSHKAFLKFVCADKNKIIVESSENCKHKFIWETMYACPIQNNTDLPQPKINQETVHTKSIDKIIINSEDTDQNNSILKETHLETQESDSKIKPEKYPISAKVVTKTVTKKVRLELRTTTEKLPTITESNVITLSVPIQVSNTTGLYINNCTLANHDMPNNNYSLFLLPRNVNVTSTNGRRYSLNLCSPQKRLTVTNLKLDYANRLVEMNLQGNSYCNDASKLGFYNSVILLKCSQELHSPQVIMETICSVQLEWKNNAACALLESNIPEEDTLKTNSTGIPLAVPILSVFVFLCVIASIAFYLWRRKQWRNANPIFYSRGRSYAAVKDISKTV